MKFSLNWLKDFVDIPKQVSPEGLAEALTLHVAEVEEVIDLASQFEKMVIGEIVEIGDHPNADKLKVCKVGIGKSKKQIVCGGDNIYEGMKVAVALPGARVRWHGEGDLVELEKAKIRGEESFGMICASAEIGLAASTDKQPEGERGVADLKGVDSKPGTSLAEALALQDVVFDIDNKSITNRADLWGHRGLAREIAAVYGVDLKGFGSEDANSFAAELVQHQITGAGLRQSSLQESSSSEPTQSRAQSSEEGEREIDLKISIKDEDLCSRYVGVVMDGITVGESPDWLKSRLQAVGQRSINNIVDISNYVMLELGQPVHIFDKSKVKSQKSKVDILVRKSKKEEKIITLDGTERELDNDMLVIADSEKSIAVAGVMGGSNSEVDENTISIVIEVAHFDALSVRQTAARLGLRSDASARFEKSLDGTQCKNVLLRVAELIKQISSGARIVSEVIDVGLLDEDVQPIEIPFDFIQRKIGDSSLDKEHTQSILKRLGFDVKQDGDVFSVTPPSWRLNGGVSIKEDVVEEIARIYGYNNIDTKLPVVQSALSLHDPFVDIERKLKEYLVSAFGLTEIHNYSFVSGRDASVWGYQEDDLVELLNPPAQNTPFMRPSLLPGIWKNVQDNLRWRDTFALFEIGSVILDRKSKFADDLMGVDYLDEPDGHLLPLQTHELSIAFVGSDIFLEMKGIMEQLFGWFRYDVSFKPSKCTWLDENAALTIQVGGKTVGHFGLVSPSIAGGLKTASEVGMVRISLDVLTSLSQDVLIYKPLPQFPATTRDIAFVLDDSKSYEEIVGVFEDFDLLESTRLFDIYYGEQVGEGKKSMAFHLVFRDSEKTLTDEEVDIEFEKMVTKLEKSLGAEIRR